MSSTWMASSSRYSLSWISRSCTTRSWRLRSSHSRTWLAIKRTSSFHSLTLSLKLRLSWSSSRRCTESRRSSFKKFSPCSWRRRPSWTSSQQPRSLTALQSRQSTNSSRSTRASESTSWTIVPTSWALTVTSIRTTWNRPWARTWLLSCHARRLSPSRSLLRYSTRQRTQLEDLKGLMRWATQMTTL